MVRAGKQIGNKRSGSGKTPTAGARLSRLPSGGSRSAIVVAGMHRSGTSALTRVLNLLGAELPKHLMPAGSFNEAGHWESTAIMHFHDAVLASIGRAWHDWREFEPGWFKSEAAKSSRAQLVEVIREEYGHARLFVVKDPRLCRLLPLWLDALREMDVTPHVLMPVRNPIEVARSLIQRDHSVDEIREPKAAHAYLLWLRSVLEAELASRAESRVVLTYDDLLVDWRQVISTIASRTALKWKRSARAASPSIDNFLSTHLRHHAVEKDDLGRHPEISAWVKEAYFALLELSRNGDSKRGLGRLDDVRAAVDEGARAFFPFLLEAQNRIEIERRTVLKLLYEVPGAEDDLEGKQRGFGPTEGRVAGRIKQLHNELDDLKVSLGATRTEVARLERQRIDEMRALLELSTKFEQSQRREQELLGDSERLQGDLRASAQMLENYSNERASAKSVIEDLNRQLITSRGDQARASSSVERLSTEVAALKDKNLVAVRQAQEVARELRQSVKRIEETEAAWRVDKQRLLEMDELLSRYRAKSESDRKSNEELRQQLAAVLPERVALVRQLGELQENIDRLKTRVREQDEELRGTEEVLTARNWRLSLLALQQSILRDFETAAKTVRRKIGKVPFGLVFQNAQLRSLSLTRAEPRRRRRSEWKTVADSGLFDPTWYLAQNQDVAGAGADPFVHFMTYGIGEDRAPHPLFSSGWYRIQMYRRGVPMDLPPLLHYLSAGRAERLSPHPLFDPQYYLTTYRDVADSGVDPFQHFLTHGGAELRNPHPLIWMQRLAEQPGFAPGSRNLLVDYVSNQQLFAVSPHPLFDAVAYLTENSDVVDAGLNPLMHYCAVGWRQGCAANPLFAADWYLARNPDVLAADIEPLAHYVRYGAQEYRAPHPLFDIEFYYARYRDARRLPYDALSDYIMNGLGDEPRETSAAINVEDIRALIPSFTLEKKTPISAFLDCNLADGYPASRTATIGALPKTAWPPAPVPAYWLPQRLRDYILERFGEEAIGLYVYLMAIVDRYGQRQGEFPQSRDFSILFDRLCLKAAQRQTVGDAPDVSVIMPVFNNVIYTMTSVVSLLEQDTHYSYEILIGDDGSTDATIEVFTKAGGCIRTIRHEKNLSFLGNCNRTASFATGRILMFLNNDTLLLPNWLDALVEVLDGAPRAGLAGSKFLNADGTLQEAGGILWQDGSAWNFGRNDDPRLPTYNYLKDVDYVSGASIALPSVLWKQLGGFDSEFAPAYCEDSDLAFRVRLAGLRTLYVPQSMLIHHEGKSHGRTTDAGIKAFQVENQKKLFARWRHILEKNHPNGKNVFVARDRSTHKPHILFIDHYIPQWDRDAGSRTMFHFLRLFVAEGFQVSFWPDNLFEDRDYCAPLQRMGIEVIYGRSHAGGFEKFVAEAGSFLDYVLVSRPEVAIKYYDALRIHSQARILYYGHDIHWKRMEREGQFAPANPDGAHKIESMRSLELENWHRADVVLYPSVDERDVVRGLVGQGAAERVPMLGYLPEELAVAEANLARFNRRDVDELLFVGGSHPPNVDALVWFASEVMPQVLAGNPRARLNIVGATKTAAVERLDSEAIRVLGRLSDDELAALYASMGVAVVPLRYGAGVKGKTLEAFMNAIPLVTTSIGLQGIADDRQLAFVADDVVGLANAVLRAQTDRTTARAQAEAAARYVEKFYSMQALRAAFARFVVELETARRDKAVRAGSG